MAIAMKTSGPKSDPLSKLMAMSSVYGDLKGSGGEEPKEKLPEVDTSNMAETSTLDSSSMNSDATDPMAGMNKAKQSPIDRRMQRYGRTA